jgi:hypothetical protein
MQPFQQKQKIISLLTTALECSFYVSPKNPGLTYDELLGFGRHFDLEAGEIGDAMAQVTTMYAPLQWRPDCAPINRIITR